MKFSIINPVQAVNYSGAFLLILSGAFLLLRADSSLAGTWVGGTATWTQANGAPWGGTAPVAGESINLTQSGGPFTITYLAGTDSTTPLYGVLNLGNATSTNTLSVGGNSGTPGEETLLAGNFNVNSGGKVELNAGGTIGHNPVFASVFINGGGSAVQTGGTWVTNNGDFVVASTDITKNAHYTINGGGALLNPRQTIIGQGIFGAGTAGNAIFDLISGTVTNASTNVQVGHSSMGSGTLNVSGGSISASLLNVYKTGTVNLSNGQLSFANEGLHGGIVKQTGGTNAIVFSLRVADTVGDSATYEMTGGVITARELLVGANFGGGPITVGGQGNFIQNGGSITLSGNSSVPGLQISHGSATANSTYTFRNATLLGTTNKFTVETLGTFQGYGTVGITGAFTNFGRIISNGEGIDRTLNLTALGTLATAENTTNKGWFAVDHGKLTLRGVNLSATTNWGEQAGDVQIDMVNSAQLRFSDLAGTGTLNGSLLAVDRTDVPAAPAGATFISVHDFSTTGSATFSSFDLDIRFDELLLPTGPNWVPALFQYNGSSWVEVASNIDYVNSIISAQGLTSLGLFAVGANYVPEPSSMVLLGLGALGLVRQSRRRRSAKS